MHFTANMNAYLPYWVQFSVKRDLSSMGLLRGAVNLFVSERLIQKISHTRLIFPSKCLSYPRNMEKGTKPRIIATAIRCFNQRGYANVSLQDLARELQISRGNLAYHFATKDILLSTIFGQLTAKLEQERRRSRNLPSFTNLRQELERYRAYQEQYAFIFTDSQVMSIPQIRTTLREMSNATIADNRGAIAFAIQVGNMRPEPFPGVYHQLAFVTWMLMFFWLPQRMLRGEVSGEDAEKTVWSMIVPHFTEKGINVFKKYYGAAFIEELGPPFEFSPEDVMLF